MSSYLKWELKDYFTSKVKWFAAIGVILLLFLIIPLDNEANEGFFTNLICLAYMFIIIASLLGLYFAGTKRVVNSFSKKTFLLESMIPIPAKKVLLTKYILGIIINAVYFLVIVLSLIVLMIKGAGVENTFKFFEQLIKYIDFVEFAKAMLLLICSSLAFLSVVVLCFVAAKAMKPGGKYDKFIGFVLAVIVIYSVSYFLTQIIQSNANIFLQYIVYLLITACAFFITANLVENKLEIYN